MGQKHTEGRRHQNRITYCGSRLDKIALSGRRTRDFSRKYDADRERERQLSSRRSVPLSQRQVKRIKVRSGAGRFKKAA